MKFCPVVPEICRRQVHVPQKARKKERKKEREEEEEEEDKKGSKNNKSPNAVWETADNIVAGYST
jgi:hypothetical protein